MIDPEGGPALAMPPEWNRQRQVSGLWYDGNKFPGLSADANAFVMQQTPPDLDEYGDLLYAKAAAPTWWTVDLWGIEVTRFMPGAGTVQPLVQSALIAQGGRNTRLKARVVWENMQVRRSVDVDIGTGTRFSVEANNLRIMLLIPKAQRFQEVGSVVNTVRSNNTQLGNGLVLDAMVGGSVYPCFAPLSNRYSTFTQLVAQLTEEETGVVTPREILVPPDAKYLSIYPSGDPVLTPWTWQTTTLASGGAALGPVDYDPAINAVVRRPVPQNIASVTQAATVFRRRWNMVWELEL